MSVHINHFTVNTELSLLLKPFDNLVLLRLCCEGGAKRTSLIKDLKTLLSQKFSFLILKREIDFSIQRLIDLEYIQKSRGLFLATIIGRRICANFFALSFSNAPTWKEIKNGLILGKALGLDENFDTCRELLSDPFLVWALILKKEYNLNFHITISKEELCRQLALCSLIKAFGEKGKNLTNNKLNLSPKLARLFASYLSGSGKHFSSYRSLFITLAAEAIGARKVSDDAIKDVLTRNFINEFLGHYNARKNKSSQLSCPHSSGSPTERMRLSEASRKEGSEGRKPPTLDVFALAIRDIVRQSGQGWSGSKKIFISRLWDALSNQRESWGLSEVDFKRMLTEAHRRGDLMLCIADLKSEELLHDIEKSATPDRNVIWHYVRVED